jgi:hypothetical protein
MRFYGAYGLTVVSALPLPGLLPGSGKADVFIELAAAEGDAPLEPTPIVCVAATPELAHLSWGGVGELRIEQGRRITVRPVPGAEEDALRLFVLGAGFGVLLHQRGLLVLHASAVAVEGRAVGFVGPKGFGKSTTAAALHKRGHPLISDELLAVRFDGPNVALVVPGPPELRLWSDSLLSTGENPNLAVKVRSGIDKFKLSAMNVVPDELPLHRLYLLDAGEQSSIRPTSPSEALFGVIPHLYAHRFGTAFMQATGAARPFEQMYSLLRKASVRRLVRRRDLAQLPDIARLVEQDLLHEPGTLP